MFSLRPELQEGVCSTQLGWKWAIPAFRDLAEISKLQRFMSAFTHKDVREPLAYSGSIDEHYVVLIRKLFQRGGRTALSHFMFW